VIGCHEIAQGGGSLMGIASLGRKREAMLRSNRPYIAAIHLLGEQTAMLIYGCQLAVAAAVCNSK
jgi:hypothetical protein